MIAKTTTDRMLAQLDDVLNEFRELQKRSQYTDASDLPDNELVRFITRARGVIHRVAAKPSVYVDQCEETIELPNVHNGHKAQHLYGVVDSLRADVSAGYLEGHRELIHGELFADFLEMAEHLLGESYKDAAAVIGGSSLEAHLRQLCLKAGIDTEMSKPDGTSPPKAADRLNTDLVKAQVYAVLDQKNVTAWLDLRNKAAHGHYDQYEVAQVRLMISGIRDFITRNRA